MIQRKILQKQTGPKHPKAQSLWWRCSTAWVFPGPVVMAATYFPQKNISDLPSSSPWQQNCITPLPVLRWPQKTGGFLAFIVLRTGAGRSWLSAAGLIVKFAWSIFPWSFLSGPTTSDSLEKGLSFSFLLQPLPGTLQTTVQISTKTDIACAVYSRYKCTEEPPLLSIPLSPVDTQNSRSPHLCSSALQLQGTEIQRPALPSSVSIL